MRRLPIRRSQLVGTNGPGSLIVSPEGETAIIGALDYWFTKEAEQEKNRVEFEIFEPRLKGFLGVKKLYMPPDYRKAHEDVTNANLTIPLLRFPLWHYCPFCKDMYELDYKVETARKFCETCNNQRYLKQVPFIIVCKKGHISDFPWREWVHNNDRTECNGILKLNTNGGSTLDSWSVKCSCGDVRSLKGITSNRKNNLGASVLSEELNIDNRRFTCSGHKAWCADEKEGCDENPVAILRNSINVYLPQKVNIISLPGEKNQNVDILLDYLKRQTSVLSIIEGQSTFEEKVKVLYDAVQVNIKVSREDCEKTILYMFGDVSLESKEESTSLMNLRDKEFEKLQYSIDEPYLKVQEEWIDTREDAAVYAGNYKKFFKRINRVTKLRETTALAGFKRLNQIEEGSTEKFDYDYDLIYQKKVPDNEKWLPAYSVFGEGIFIQFNLNQIQEWEEKEEVQEYYKNYLNRISGMRHFMPEIIENPRNLMMHTLSHLIIEEIANTSGYSMASIRERLFVNENQAAILIYTSAGDVEGTFGGLVRLGRKEKFFHLIDKAFANSQWCSSDPVCTELGITKGQGLHNANGAACYNCVHLPETSCEVGNMYLDRRLISDATYGFFDL
ncbi:DrmB family protein [Bacillus cereus]|uniref:DUF1998 domain-containing protein n=1 Tax=Bacillus cereus group TaxID=86661 RepID=UPI0008FE3383|nr:MULTISPECIES: DUF1998 domain-containing protein [Bacillus cereus group]MBR9673917.1 hypothetical protein [Bacillus cereus]MCB5899953.1 DUF1998 domain-containing protein [Bacillus cereus]OJD97056.1 hypothetical protein A9485_28120 [Bacillus cereus]OUB07377.1 hypothetical protein BK708_38840 [Bacillus thuringiensis serovar yunnanensis]